MKILFIFIIPSGGMETLNRQRCSSLNRIGITSHFLYLKEGSGIQNINGANTFITNDDSKINSIILNENYDCIIVCSEYLLLRKIREIGYKGPLIFDIQGLGEEKNVYSLLQSIKGEIEPYSDGILSPKTPHLIENIKAVFPQMKHYYFHNCFDVTKFSYKQINEMNNSPIIGWVGRLEKNKNWSAFLEIGYLFKRENPTVQLWMVHDPLLANQRESAAFYKKVKRLKLGNNIKIYSNVKHEQMQCFYSIIGDSGGFLCSTSITEGFGYAVVEALACRCPVITTDSDGVKSFIIHNETGKYFHNITEAYFQGKELMENLQLRNYIRENGEKFIIEKLNPEQYATNFRWMLNDLGVK